MRNALFSCLSLLCPSPFLRFRSTIQADLPKEKEMRTSFLMLQIILLLATYPCGSLAQCNICAALGNGFCPQASGVTVGTTCNSCSSVTVGGCQTCGGGACYTSLSACNAACTPGGGGGTTTTLSSTTTPAASGVMVGVALYSSSTTCSGSPVYEFFEVNRCDNLHGTGYSLLITTGPSYNFKLFSNYECSGSSPTINTFTSVANGACTSFLTVSVSLFLPTTTTSPPMTLAGTYTQVTCASPTTPSVTCASVFSSAYTLTQSGNTISWSGPSSTGTVYDKGLVAIRTTSGGSYGSCYGWFNNLQLHLDCFTTNSAQPRLEVVYSCSGACSSPSATTTTTSSSATTSPSSSGTTCFHKSTSIVYKGLPLSLSALPEDCRIPHRVRSNGVAIYTSCDNRPLRLTADHLVFTAASGLKPAGELHTHEILFGDLDETQQCKILRITQEHDQLYFGLNCLESVVLANGLKTSTFGTYHSLPAAWMSWAGSILGIDRASRWGDALATIAEKIKLI